MNADMYKTTFNKYGLLFKDYNYMHMLEANAMRYGCTNKQTLLKSISKIERAIDAIEDSISFRRNYASAVVTFCEYHGKDGYEHLIDNALKNLNDALGKKPDFALYRVTKAKIYEIQEDYENAYECILDAIEIEHEANKQLQYTHLKDRLSILKNSKKKLEELDHQYNVTLKKMEKMRDEMNRTKMDMIQTLGLFAAIIAVIVSGVVTVNAQGNAPSVNLPFTFYLLLEVCSICVIIFSVFSILFSKQKYYWKQIILCAVGVISLIITSVFFLKENEKPVDNLAISESVRTEYPSLIVGDKK